MEFAFESHPRAVERSVSSLERDGRPVRAVTLSRSDATTLEGLWDAVTNAERIPRWFSPISGSLELGGRYQLEGNAGGTITSCQPPAHFAVTWEFAGDVSWVKVRVSDEATGRPRLTLTHTALPSSHWDTYGPGAVGVGWELGFLGLAIHLAHPNEPKPDEIAFVTSPAGRAFIKVSSTAWGEAAVAAGEDPTASRAAAGRTSAFYTGESAEPNTG